ncbi:MAG: transposase [Anaerolineae bacterium]
MPRQPVKQERVFYHVTFQTQRRLPAVYDEVEAYFREAVPKIAKRGKFAVLEIGVVPTHVHLLVEKAPWADGYHYERHTEKSLETVRARALHSISD